MRRGAIVDDSSNSRYYFHRLERIQIVFFGSFVGSEMLSGNSGDQVHRYLGLHVRFEKDMIAHSACYYGGGRAEKRALAAFRAKIWRLVAYFHLLLHVDIG